MGYYLLFILGLVFLVKGADYLVNGAASVAKRFNISNLVIGLTLVAFGTSCPELFVNIIASSKGNVDIAIGNILGSNIANIFLILGISAIILPLTVTKGTVWKEIPFALLAAVLLGVAANDQLIDKTESLISRIDGIMFLSFFLIFMIYLFSIAKNNGVEPNEPEIKSFGLIKSFLFVLLGLFCLILGSKWMVDSAVWFAHKYGFSESLIGLTIVAVGTSLPELATSAVAAYKKNAEIAVGNIIGSNIFNIFFILGISALIRPLPFKPKNNIDISVMILATVFLFISMFTGGKRLIDRWEGLLFIFFYVVYIVYLIISG